ncbi:MAG: phosphatase PAP2 family protein [bacterium]
MLAALLVSAGALLGFIVLGYSVVSGETTSLDGAVQRWMLAHQVPLARTISLWISTVGDVTSMRVVAIVGAGWLWFRGRGVVAASMLFVPIVADWIFHVAKRVYARARPVGLGAGVDSSYAFPSGHATVSAAVCAMLAYVLMREGVVSRHTALAIALIVPLLVGASRVYLNVHWATDVLGGWCAGLFIASLAIALSDRRRA